MAQEHFPIAPEFAKAQRQRFPSPISFLLIATLAACGGSAQVSNETAVAHSDPPGTAERPAASVETHGSVDSERMLRDIEGSAGADRADASRARTQKTQTDTRHRADKRRAAKRRWAAKQRRARRMRRARRSRRGNRVEPVAAALQGERETTEGYDGPESAERDAGAAPSSDTGPVDPSASDMAEGATQDTPGDAEEEAASVDEGVGIMGWAIGAAAIAALLAGIVVLLRRRGTQRVAP